MIIPVHLRSFSQVFDILTLLVAAADHWWQCARGRYHITGHGKQEHLIAGTPNQSGRKQAWPGNQPNSINQKYLMEPWSSPKDILCGKLKGGSYVDNCCGTDRSVGTRAGEQLHDGRVYSYFTGDRHCRGVDQSYSGEKDFIVDEEAKPDGFLCLHELAYTDIRSEISLKARHCLPSRVTTSRQ